MTKKIYIAPTIEKIATEYICEAIRTSGATVDGTEPITTVDDGDKIGGAKINNNAWDTWEEKND